MAWVLRRPPTWTTIAVLAFVIPVTATTTYLVTLNRRVSKFTSAASGQRHPVSSSLSKAKPSIPSSIPSSIPRPVSLPPDVASDDSEWVLAYERAVTEPISLSSLKYPAPSSVPNGPGTTVSPSALLTAYSRAVQVAFSHTPQASLIRGAVQEPEAKRTFDTDFINALPFTVGDMVCGIWRVAYRGATPGVEDRPSERIECVGDPPASYKGERIGVVIISAVDVVGEDKVVFSNETWMWRKPSAKATLIETSVGGWLHVLLAKWLICKGIEATSVEPAKGKGE